MNSFGPATTTEAHFPVSSAPGFCYLFESPCSEDHSMSEPDTAKPQLPRTMGFWDVLLFNIAAVLGPRWIAAAAHNGTSSISLWVLAAVLFFLPTALIIIELSTRFPSEGGLYVWSKEAFGDFHGFVAGWSYW